jgi:AcrR family transcriptional regulator
LHKKTSRSEAPRPSLRVIQREDTRRRLLAAARKLFRARGVEQAAMEDIASAAAVSRATIYLHFPGKPALLEALLEEDWAGQIKLFEWLRDIDFGDGDQLGRWILRVAEGMRKARDSFGIHRAALGQNPELTIRHHQHRAALAQILLQAAGIGAELTREVEAELIVAELEHFATAAAVGWTEDRTAAALPLVVERLREFARA